MASAYLYDKNVPDKLLLDGLKKVSNKVSEIIF